MSINFPSSLDTFSNPTGTDLLENAVSALDHDVQHSNANDAIEALEAKVGINSSGVTTSHDYKLSAVTGSDKALKSGTSTQSVTNLTLVTPTLTLNSDTTGDMYYRNSGGALTRLPAGTDGQIISYLAGIPTTIANPAAADASTTVKGVSEIATTAEITAGTSTGGTGAKLVVPADAVGSPAAYKLVQYDSAGKLPAVDGSQLTNLQSSFLKTSTQTINQACATATVTKICEFTGLSGNTDDVYEMDFEIVGTQDSSSASDYLILRFNDNASSSNYSYVATILTDSSATSTNYVQANDSTIAGVPMMFGKNSTQISVVSSINGHIRIKVSRTIAGIVRSVISDSVSTSLSATFSSMAHSTGCWTDTTNQVTSMQLYYIQNSGSSSTVTGYATLYKITR